MVLIDLGIMATVEVTELREMPPLFLQDFALIPPQVCLLGEVPSSPMTSGSKLLPVKVKFPAITEIIVPYFSED